MHSALLVLVTTLVMLQCSQKVDKRKVFSLSSTESKSDNSPPNENMDQTEDSGGTETDAQIPATLQPPTQADASPAPTLSPDANCSGKIVAKSCWYLSGAEKSCAETCENHGGFNPATREFAGDRGTNGGCQDVFRAVVGKDEDRFNETDCDVDEDIGAGCFAIFYRDRTRPPRLMRCKKPPTTAEARFPNWERLCACMR